MAHILIAPDKFKGSLTARQVCQAVGEGLSKSSRAHQITMLPLADGGEGTCELLTEQAQGKMVSVTVTGPDFTPVAAMYGISGDGSTAFIEMASASGLELLPLKKRNPAQTTTYGTGQLIGHAVENGISKIVLAIGGSATNDAGIGMASALGFEFFDLRGNELAPVGASLRHLHEIKTTHVMPRLRSIQTTTLCDVNNPLHGPRGAAYVYAPQKGADGMAVKQLDEGLRNFEKVVRHCFDQSADFPGAGAAGGLGAGTKVFLNARLAKGFDYIAEATGLMQKLRSADMVITGEGKLDRQSLSGKVVMEVAARADGLKTPVVVICGRNEINSAALAKAGIHQVIALTDNAAGSQEAMDHAYQLIVDRIHHHLPLLGL